MFQCEIKLRKYNEKDIPYHYQAVVTSTQNLQPWFSFAKSVYSKDDSERFIKQKIPNDENNNLQYHFAIVNSKDEFLGSCSLLINPNNRKVAAMNYWIKKGICKVGKRAAKLLKEIGCSKLGLSEIHLDIADCNIKSIKVAESIGAKAKYSKMLCRYDGKPPTMGKRYVVEC